MEPFDLVVQNGTLVTAGETVRADIGIRGEQIAALGQGLRGREALDAGGLLVLPGGVDPHVHLEMPAGAVRSSDDFVTGSIAAACGGTTTLLDFVEPEPGETLAQALQARRAQAEGRAVVDFGLHMTLTDTRPPALAEVEPLVAAGVSSFKVYTTYDGFRLDDAGLYAALEAVGQAGGLVMVHAENDVIVGQARRALLAAGRTGPQAHPLSRPAAAEGEAVERMLALAETAQAPVYIVHTSTRRGAEAIARARGRGQVAYGETCPQYLVLTEAEYARPGFEGAKFVCSPPLRSEADRVALWRALANGQLQSMGTDHCPFFYRGAKELGRELFTLIPGGIPGIEARLALLYTWGVRAGWISPGRWVELCSTAPARLFGLYPRKGSLLPGADADLVLFDPQRRVTLRQEMLHENVDYTPYEGLELHGYPVATLRRGQLLAREGEYVGPQGGGRFLACGRPQAA
jgi:dihydropyrimidinase